MKTFFLKSFAVAAMAAPTVSAFSLYDTAPVVGLAESQPAKYFASVRTGYDTHPGSSSSRGNGKREGSMFVGGSLSTTYSDVESVDKLSYSARLGGTRYVGGSGVNGQRYSANCGADVRMVHAFDAMSRYSGNLSLSYQPEPGYDNGISSQGLHGDSLTWSLSNNYSSALDARWSWNAGMNYSGTQYEQKTSRTDDRQYMSGHAGLNYKESDLLTYTANVSYREELRSYGMNSKSAFGTVGIQRALDTVSSCSAAVGAQMKMMGGETRPYPTVDLGYRRRVTDGLSMNAYVKYSNENVDNYSVSTASSYKSSAAWRLGMYGTYVLSPDVSFVGRIQSMYTAYRRNPNPAMPDYDRYSYSGSVTMNYSFSPEVHGSLTVEYSKYYDGRTTASCYNRMQYSAGLSYRF